MLTPNNNNNNSNKGERRLLACDSVLEPETKTRGGKDAPTASCMRLVF